MSHTIHVWYIYLHLVDVYDKCRYYIPCMDAMGVAKINQSHGSYYILIPWRIHGTIVYLPTFTWLIWYIAVGTFLPLPRIDPLGSPPTPRAAACLVFTGKLPWSWSALRSPGCLQKTRNGLNWHLTYPKDPWDWYNYLPGPSKGCQLNAKGWRIDTL